jgi:transposase
MLMVATKVRPRLRRSLKRFLAAGDRQALHLQRFLVLPKHWVVERTLAWISNCRRLATDSERHARKAAAIRLAMIRVMLRRIAANPLT